MTPINTVVPISAFCLLLAGSPLLSGFIRKVKNNLRMRRGARILQPYYDLAKLWSKGRVVSTQTSWIFSAAPVIVCASSVSACMVVAGSGGLFSAVPAGILLAVFFLFALGRFFLALAGLDAGSSFGGMGSSREMFISALAEPALFVSLLVIGFNYPSQGAGVSTLLAGCAFFMVMLAETSRIPVDNQETHLELTMVHEAMVLEYSGRSLALIELGGHIRQIVLFVLLARFVSFLPVLLVIVCLVAVVEVSLAKMRLFRVVDYLGFALFIALMAAVAAALRI